MASQWLKLTVALNIACLTVAVEFKSEQCTSIKGAGELECAENEEIKVTSAKYTAYEIKGWLNRRCGFDRLAFFKVKSRCDGKSECKFPCNDDMFNITTCKGKYFGRLQAKYKCERDPCRTFCCSNGGTCELKSDGTPMCVCNGSWTGTNCEDNPCSSMMCQNDGSCLINPADGTAQCVCTKDFTGTTCETEKENPCDSLVCQNDGSCLINPVDNTAQCCCTADYTGEACQTKLDACSTVQCENGGSCTVSGTGEAVCQCPTGFVGTLCEVDCNLKQPCPDGFQELPEGSGNCYFICDFDAQSWLAAEDFCHKKGSVLWEPNDMTEVNAVTPTLNADEKYWTGATDSLIEDTTVFSGSGLPFTLTTTGSNTVSKDCLQYEKESASSGFQFLYRECTSQTRRCICETQDECRTPVPPITLALPVSPVPPLL